MIRVLIPVIIVLIIAVTVSLIHKRESKVSELKRLRKENAKMTTLLENLDSAADAEYTVTNNHFAGFVRTEIKDHDIA